MTTVEQYMIPCINKQLFGFDCLGCGLQRSLYALIQGDIKTAFIMYPAIFPLILLFAAIGINLFFKYKFSNRIINILAISAIATIILSYLIKITN